MKVQVLGGGCAKCHKLADNAKKALELAGIEAEIEKVTDMQEIIRMGVMTTPALAVDGRVVISGRVPSPKAIVKLL